MKKRKNSLLFVTVSIISLLFLIMPFLLRINLVDNALSWFLQPLRNSDYKSSYTEIIGAILGTFLAVTGTLWTQRKIDEGMEQKEIQKKALIVYYDFYFALNDLIDFMKSYLSCKKSKTVNVIDDWDTYKKFKKKYRIYIDSDWIHNVAELSSQLENDEIQMIYKIYGDLHTIERSFNNSESLLEENDKLTYNIIFREICNVEVDLSNPISFDVQLKEDKKVLLEKLKEIAQI